MFLNYIEKYGDNYDQILASDTRDVIFQGDVFKQMADKGNYLGYTTEGAKIGEDKGNTDWIANQYGKEEADKLADKKIICCGTIIGTSNEMKTFLRTFVENVAKVQVTSIDQGIWNYIVHEKLVPIENLLEIDVQTGEILTAQLFHERNPMRFDGDLILRGDGKVPAVVHQYDRQPVTAMLVNRVYRSKDFQPNYQLTDMRNALEQIPHIVRRGNIEEAMRFFMNYVVGKTDFEGYGDMLIDTWGNVLETETPARPFKESLEVSLQYAIESAVSKNFLLLQLKRMTPHLISAVNNHRPLSGEFKIFVANGLFVFANMCFNEGAYQASKSQLDLIKALNIPLGQNFLDFQAKVDGKLNPLTNPVANPFTFHFK